MTKDEKIQILRDQAKDIKLWKRDKLFIDEENLKIVHKKGLFYSYEYRLM